MRASTHGERAIRRTPAYRPVAATGLLLASLLAACGGSKSEVDGVWSVDFGKSGGVLALREGGVYAHCLGRDIKVGRFAVEGAVMTLSVRFNPKQREQQIGGTVVREDSGFRIDRDATHDWVFTPYTGNCSDVKRSG